VGGRFRNASEFRKYQHLSRGFLRVLGLRRIEG